MRFETLLWLFPVVVTLHNAEEAIWFPDWSRRAARWYPAVSPGVFRFAAAVLTVLAYVMTWMGARSGKQAVWTYLAFGYIVAMLINALIPHLAVTVATRSYMPGVATAVVLNLPALSLLAVLALRQGYVTGWRAAAYALAVPIALLFSIPALFKLGKVLNLGG